MVASKRIHCVICNKKCSGNVLRYQDHYYHKQCFELEQSQGADAGVSGSLASGATSGQLQREANQSQQHQQDPWQGDLHSADSISLSSSRRDQQQQVSSSQVNLPTTAMKSAKVLGGNAQQANKQQQLKSQTLDRSGAGSGGSSRAMQQATSIANNNTRSATLPHSSSVPANGFLPNSTKTVATIATCAGCKERIKEGQSLIALDRHWHVWCFKCAQCQAPLHAEYVAKDSKAYCEKDYQKLFGVACVYCKRYITGKVLQAGEAHHFHPSCARCSKCGDPFVPGEEMYLQGEVTWHPRCGPGPQGADQHSADDQLTSGSQLRASRGQSPSLSSRSQSRSASPFSFMSRQYGRSSPGYADSEAVGDLSRVYTISYLNADPTQGYLRRPIEPQPPKSPQFSRPASVSRLGGDNRSRSSSRSHHHYYNGAPPSHLSRDRSVPRGLYSVLSGSGRGSQIRAKSPSMMNEEAIQLAAYPSGQRPSPGQVPPVERDDFPAPPFPVYASSRLGGASKSAGSTLGSSSNRATSDSHDVDQDTVERSQREKLQQPQQQRRSRPKSRELALEDEDDLSSNEGDPQLKKEEEELSKIANGIGKIFLQTLKEREKLRAWKRANLDPRNASRTPSATRELASRPLRYDNPTNASPSRDMDRPRVWDETDGLDDHSPTRTRSSLGVGKQQQTSAVAAPMSPSTYGYKVVQSNRFTPKPGYGLQAPSGHQNASELSFSQQQVLAQSRAGDLLRPAPAPTNGHHHQSELMSSSKTMGSIVGSSSNANHRASLASSAAHLRRSMPNVSNLSSGNHRHLHLEGPPKLYPYHLLATSNYRLPPDVDRCHLERHLSNEEFQYIFHCDRIDFYRLPEWKRNELKRRAKLF